MLTVRTIGLFICAWPMILPPTGPILSFATVPITPHKILSASPQNPRMYPESSHFTVLQENPFASDTSHQLFAHLVTCLDAAPSSWMRSLIRVQLHCFSEAHRILLAPKQSPPF